MKQGLTEIVLILDRSSSMAGVINATVEGVNGFIAEQAKLPGEAKFTHIQFSSAAGLWTLGGSKAGFESNDGYMVVESGVPLAKAQRLVAYENYSCHGGTALLDAIGRTIETVGERLRNTPEAERAEKVVFVIQTDGEENSSHKFNLEHIRSMIEHQTSKYNWQFLFLSSGLDGARFATSISIAPASTILYAQNEGTARGIYGAASKSLRSYRSNESVSASFDDESRTTIDSLSKGSAVVDNLGSTTPDSDVTP